MAPLEPKSIIFPFVDTELNPSVFNIYFKFSVYVTVLAPTVYVTNVFVPFDVTFTETLCPYSTDILAGFGVSPMSVPFSVGKSNIIVYCSGLYLALITYISLPEEESMFLSQWEKTYPSLFAEINDSPATINSPDDNDKLFN